MEPSLTEQQAKKVGKYLGIRDSNQLNQVVSDETPPKPTHLEIERQKKLAAIDVPVETDPDVSASIKHLIDLTKQSAREISLSFQAHILELFKNYNSDKGSKAFTPEIANKMIKRGYDLPQFSIKQGESARAFLESTGNLSGTSSLLKDSVLLIFNLPRPIARFWYKGGQDSWGEGAQKVDPNNIEWGHFYREIMDTVWEGVGVEEFKGLAFQRINDLSDHKLQKYYYIWAVKLLHP